MNSVKVISGESFKGDDLDILNVFVEFQQAMIDKDEDKLNEIILDGYSLTHMSGKKQSKDEFISEILDGTLNYYESIIEDISINSGVLKASVTLDAKVYGIRGKWTLDSVANFEKIDGKWYFDKWEN